MARRSFQACVLRLRFQASLRGSSLALDPGVDLLDHLAVMAAKAVLGDVAEMRRQHEIVELAEGMVDRQRLD